MKIDFEGAGVGYKSYCGAFISVTYITLVVVFLWSKVQTLALGAGVNIRQTTMEDAID